jgi:hypothetical protein
MAKKGGSTAQTGSLKIKKNTIITLSMKKTTNYKRTEKTRPHVRQLRENVNITRQAMHV